MDTKPKLLRLRLGRPQRIRLSELKLLLFWPLWFLLFTWLESREIGYHIVECSLDDKIPFLEIFIIPYYFWFVFIAGTLLYGLVYDRECYRKMMAFIAMTYLATAVIYIVLPSQQVLRPTVFPRHNFLTNLVAGLYASDTNTNVCPSIHVIGSMAAVFAGWHSKAFSTPLWRFLYCLTALVICLSTVFLKQHSVLDSIPALVISFAAVFVIYRKKEKAVPIRDQKGK